MKLFIKLILVVLVIGLAAPFVLKDPDGKPWMNINSILPDLRAMLQQGKGALDQAVDKTKSLSGNDASSSKKTKVHKWRDENGVWQYSDTPNPDGKSEEMWVDPNTNLVKSTPMTTAEPKSEENQEQKKSPHLPVPMTVSPDKVSKLMDDAKNIQGLMDKRAKDLDGL